MTSDVLVLILRANLVAAAAILVALALRPATTRFFGARTTYQLWALVPLAALASLIPARRVVVETGAAVSALAAQRVEGPPALIPDAIVTDAVRLATPAFDPELWLFALWAIGAAASLAVLVFRQARFRRSLGVLTPEAGRYRAEACGVGPAVVGALFPRIIVPADFEDRFGPEERRVVLAHEEVHYRRGDALVNAAVAVARCLCWFNPLAHAAAHYIRLDQELACDAEVVGRFPTARRCYAEAMLKTQLAPMAGPLACYWPGRSAHPMKRRIAMLKAPTPTARRRAAGLAAVAGVSIGVGVAAWAAQPARVEAASPPSRTVAPLGHAPGAEDDLKARYSSRQLGAQLVEAIDEGYPDAIRGLVKAGADVNALVPGDGTPLVQAARLGDMATARLLLENGADVNGAAPGDGNPLITAAAHGRLEMARLLVERGADVNAFVFRDETPLINAARGGKVDLVRFLLERGADPNLTVPSGNRPGELRSPLSMAANPAIAEILRSRGARR